MPTTTYSGEWIPSTDLLTKGSEDSGMPDTTIKCTIEVPPASIEPLPTVSEYTVVMNPLLEKFITVTKSSNGVILSNPIKNFIGLFPIEIFYSDIKEKTTEHRVTDWEELPSGNNIKIYKYVAPNPTSLTYLITVTAILSNKQSLNKTYQLIVETNLDKNRNAFLKALSDRQ